MLHSTHAVPARAWVVTFAGTAVNLCLGILYAWSIWKAQLTTKDEALVGTAMTGLNEGWAYLSDAQATWAYAICGVVFALFMIPGGRIQDRYGPKVGATLGGLCVAAGCLLAGWMKSYLGLVLGFGVMGGIGMGIGYAAATPAAVQWFSPRQRGLIVGLVVGGYGAAPIYIAPLARYLIGAYGLSASFIGLGLLFAVVIVIAGQLLSRPPAGYVVPAAPINANITNINWSAGEMVKTWQFYALVALFVCAAQSGLLVIGNAAGMLADTARVAGSAQFFAANAWLLPAFIGIVNAVGRVGTGLYSDRLGRTGAYLLNAGLSVVSILALPALMQSGQVTLLFLAVGVIAWQYGGSLALLPAFTADFFGSGNLGFKYGLVFLGWGIAFFVPQLGGYIKDVTGSLDRAFYLSAGMLLAALLLCKFVRRPLRDGQ